MDKNQNIKEKYLSFTHFIVVIFTILLSATAHGEFDFSDEPPAMATDEEMMLFADIPSVYSASKHEQKITEAPSSVSIVTADEIKKYGYRDFGEILQSIRGFYVTNDRNYKYLGVRGFGLPSDYSNRVLVLIDGVRQNDNIYDAPSIGTMFQIDIDLIDRIEVVRGPGSSLYGTSAFFTVINVLTKSGRDYKGVAISGETDTFNRSKTSLSYGNRYSNGLELLLSASYLDSNGDDDLDYTDTYNANPWICPDDDPANCYGLQDAWWYATDFRAKGLDYDREENISPNSI